VRNLARYRAAARDTTLALTFLGMIGVGVASTIGFGGAWWWFFDLFAHFRVQYLVLACLFVAPLALTKRWRALAGAAALVVLNGAVVLPSMLASPAAAARDAEPLRIVSFNVHAENGRTSEIADYLRQSDADVIALLEVRSETLSAITSLLLEYEVVSEPRPDNFGIAVLSRRAIARQTIHHVGDSHLPAIEVAIEHDGGVIDILAIHPMPPIGGEGSRERDRVLASAAAWAADHSRTGVIVGDFNATPWSAAFRSLIATSKFVSSHRGFAVQATWPRQLRFLAIPIDHCIHSRRLTTLSRRAGPFLGSDHRPLHVELARRAD